MVFEEVAKLIYLVAIIGGHVIAQLPLIVRFMTKQNCVWSKALIIYTNMVALKILQDETG